MADNPLSRLPLAGQLGVSVALAAVICGGFYWFWYSEALETEKKQQAKLSAELQQQIRALEATANRLPEFQREVQALEARLETLKRILPPEKEMPDLMRRLQYLAAQSSLQIRKFNPAAVSQKEFYQEVPVNLDVEGTYHNLGAFLDRVSRLSRLVNVGNVKIKAQTKPTINNTIAASAVATTYVYREPPPAATAKAPSGRRRRAEAMRGRSTCRRASPPLLLLPLPGPVAQEPAAPAAGVEAAAAGPRSAGHRPSRRSTWSSRPAATPTTPRAAATRS
jgi:type IV pilus assembly protein PilO